MCAALAPALAHDPDATAVLLAEATRNPAVIDMRAFDGMMALTALPHAANVLAERLCLGISDVDRLLPAAIAAVPYGTTYLDLGEQHRTQGALCEPYLRAIFPEGLPSPSVAIPAQRRSMRTMRCPKAG